MKRDIFHRLYFHVVWTTAGRLPALEGRRERAVACITTIAQKFGAHVLACNTMPDHVHLLISLPPIDLAHFIGKVKGGSSFALNRQTDDTHTLRWQDGYGVISLRASDTSTVIRYIEEQDHIHTQRNLWQTLERTEPDEIT
ncbi:IS200/IS605 family transposase [Armatimonas sp.]|uniref:IS200/IS605 family transposase n=1 Tax=Armatimonas sp. TaxID=1872638 RepID=UPI00286CD34B|nr:IS200/IS605 family transposase [Armatimonas sp.]